MKTNAPRSIHSGGRLVLPLSLSLAAILAISLSVARFRPAQAPRDVQLPAGIVQAAQITGDTANRGNVSPKTCLANNGLAYGPFRDGQSPDTDAYPTVAQVQEDLTFLSQITKRIRIYGTKGTFADIPRLAKKLGISVTQGIYLSSDRGENEQAIESALQLARENLIDSIIVGNETLTGSLLPKQDLISYIQKVKRTVSPKIAVSTAEIWSVWQSNPDLANDVDFVVAHFYPFWEQHPIGGAADKLLEQYKNLQSELRRRYPGRDLKIVIGETGWPSGRNSPRAGLSQGSANQGKFLEEFMPLACGNSIPFYYFETFDEEWKWREGSSSSGDRESLPEDRTFSGRWLGASWGIFDSNGKLKPQFVGLFDQPAQGSRRYRDIFVNGGLSAYYDVGVDSSGKRRDWLGTEERGFRMSYPADQEWGAVFITVGRPGPRPHPWKDFSEFKTLSLELKGQKGGEAVEMGVMNASDPANGTERTVAITNLGKDYRTYDIPLSRFASSHLTIPQDLREIYVVVEFVFRGSKPATVYARNIRYTP